MEHVSFNYLRICRRLLILTRTELLTYNVDTGECTMHLSLKKIKDINIIDSYLVSFLFNIYKIENSRR